MKQPKLNRALLRKIRNRIAEIPKAYYQGHWYEVNADSPCGTTECIGGDAIVCSAPSVEAGIAKLRRMMQRIDGALKVSRKARSLLGLTEKEANVLFDGSGDWPGRYGRRYRRALTERTKANAAVALIDAILEEGREVLHANNGDGS